MLTNLSKFKAHLLFDQEGGGGGGNEDDEAKKKKEEADEKKFSQADLDRVVKERLDREKKKQEQEAEKIKAEAEKKALEEQGKHKELADKALKDAETAKAEKEKAEKELSTLKMQRAFEQAARDLEVEFAGDNAREDAFQHLDREAVGENLKGMETELKKLMKDRPYLFKDAEPATNTDARNRNKANAGSLATEEAIAAKRKSGQYSGV